MLIGYTGVLLSTCFAIFLLACLSVSYQCPNMECISWSYVCDGINDCGYLQSGSDEIGCNGLGWSKYLNSRAVLYVFSKHLPRL